MIAWRLAWREIRNNRRFSLFFIFNLALGLLGFVLLDTFKVALDHSLADRSRVLLSADIAVSARRPLNPTEDQALHRILPEGTREGRMLEMYSMVASPQASRLAEVAAVDENYPFYGYLELQNGGRILGETQKQIVDPKLSPPVTWIRPELATQLGIHVGDTLKLGDTSFKVDDLIQDDSGEVWRGFSLASRMYIGLSRIDETHLLRKGSTIFYSRLFLLPKDTDVEALSRKINQTLSDPMIQVRTHRNASEEVGRMLAYLNDYLGLVALVALLLAGIGAGYLFRSFLSRRTREIAILTSLGVTNRFARSVYLLQLGMLGTIAATVTSVGGALLLPAAGWAVTPYLPFPIQLQVTARTVFLALLMGSIGSILICYPILLKIRDLNPATLFQESSNPSTNFSRRQLAGALPGLLVLAVLCVWQAHSFKMGGLFFGAVIGSVVLIALAGGGILSSLRWFERSAGFRARTALRNLRRSRLSSVSCFVAIGIGSLLLNLIPQIQQSLDTELLRPPGDEVPSFFLYDIQEEQLSALEGDLQSQSVTLIGLSPLIRARMSSINGKPFEKSNAEGKFATREEEQEARSRNRGFNLSYRTQYSKAETLIKGKDFSGRYDPDSNAPAEISVERRFAERLKIKLGDTLDFDVQGIPVSGKVINFRKVRWTSFQPNFFILFQPGVLDEAPKTFIAAVPKLSMERKLAVQNEVVTRFPNISMVDVGDLVAKILEVFAQMSWALRVMAWLSLFAGFVVLFSIANHQAASRSQESNLLKVLGAGFSDVLRMIQIEFGVLGFCSAALGTLLSYFVSYLITEFLFDGDWVFTWKIELASIAGVTLLSVLTAMIATRRVIALKPIALLQSGTQGD